MTEFVQGSPTVVWLRGAIDGPAAFAEVSDVIARAITVGREDIVVDLSGVDFMENEAVGVLRRTHDFLELRTRSFTVRAPSQTARDLLDEHGSSDLIA
jgi:anti-anti-sigma factor